MVEYVPDQSDIIWVSFDSQAGREIQKKRPALVLSLNRYNKIRGMAIVVPITSKTKQYPLEVSIETKDINGYALVDQVKAIDWRQRNIKYITVVRKEVVQEVLEKFNALLGIELSS